MDTYIIHTADIQVTQLDFIIRLLVATGIGLLIGLEREYAALLKKEQIFAGIRTFVLLTLTGFAAAVLHFLLSPWIVGAVVVAVATLIGISYWITAHKGDIGGTSELAAILSILLGALSFLGYMQEALMIAVIALVFLSAKVRLLTFVGQITHEEMYALLRFVVISLLIFPFLPDEQYGPYDAINPREVGWVVILTSGLGFLGYVLMRVFGANKGTLLTGILGGLVSSTMVTWVFARKSKAQPALNAVFASAILAAATVMVGRVLLWIILFNRALLTGLVIPLGLMLIVAAGMSFYYYRKGNRDAARNQELPIGKPLELFQAIVFGLLYIGVVLVVHYAQDYFGREGILITSGIAGLSDVDAITISISRMSGSGLTAMVAFQAILIATLANTLMKCAIALWAGGPRLRRYVAIGYALIFVTGILGLLALAG